MVNHIT